MFFKISRNALSSPIGKIIAIAMGFLADTAVAQVCAPDQMFREATRLIFDAQGSFVNNAADRGGPTNWGVTQRTLSLYRGKSATVDDIVKLDIGEARDVYRKLYYNPLKADKLQPGVHYLILDIGVLHGIGGAAKMLQKAADFEVEDPMKSVTSELVAVVNAKDREQIIKSITEQRIAVYDRIVASDPSQSRFYNGWVNRANRAMGLALSMARFKCSVQ